LKYFFQMTSMALSLPRSLLVSVTVLLGACAARAAPPFGNQADYFAGVYLLQANTGLPDSVRSVKYRELEALTGISGEQARALLQLYRERPAEWKTLYDSIFIRLTRPSPAAPAVAKDTIAGRKASAKRR